MTQTTPQQAIDPDRAVDTPRFGAEPVRIGERDYTTLSGLARLLGVTVRTLSRWDEHRVGPPRIKVGKLVLYDLSKLPAWLESHETAPLGRASKSRRD